MAQVVYVDPVKELHGAFSKHGTITRCKKIRDAQGRVRYEAKAEAYKMTNPRDWKKNPPKGEELNKINRFREACHRTTEIMRAAKPENHPADEQLQTYNAYRERFLAQLDHSPDPQAPVDAATGQPKRYYRLDNFIRAIVYYELKNR